MLALLAVVSTAPPRAARAQTHLPDAGVPAGMPTFRDILSLRSVAGPAISGDGTRVAYVVSVPTWQENRSMQELWVSGIGEEAPRRVATEEDGFRGRFQWTPDGRWLVFPSTGVERPSLTLLAPDRGRSRVIDLAAGDVSEVRFSPDGRWVALLAPDPQRWCNDRKGGAGYVLGWLCLWSLDLLRRRLHCVLNEVQDDRERRYGVDTGYLGEL